jgi:PadR family transcriptional regulator PadR
MAFDLHYIVSMQSRINDKPASLGEFESLVLMAIVRLGDQAYGMGIHLELEERTGRRCAYGALYTTIDRLEQKGYISSTVGDPTPQRGGRAKKYLRIEGAGTAALREWYQTARRMAEGIEPQLEGLS